MSRSVRILMISCLALSFAIVLFSSHVAVITAGQSTMAATMAATGATQVSPTSVPTITANGQWKPVVQNFDGVEMVLVPPGCFMMGNSGEGGKQCFDTPFWIDKNDVTNGQFKDFNGKAAYASNWTGDNRPRESITWYEARDFCALRGARLPTEAEWEYVARGPDDLVYPWGNFFYANNIANSEHGQTTTDVGSKPGGASWVGALDMSGNVKQWTTSLWTPYPYDKNDGRENNEDTQTPRTLRGSGLWQGGTAGMESAFRYDWSGPSFEYRDIGFRCVRSY